MYERDFIFDVLLQIAIKRLSRHSPDRQSARLELALESLAIQISQARQSLILRSFDNGMTILATRTIQKTKSLNILQRIANQDRTAVHDCVDAYGNFIWALARKFTASREEAEAATLEIFQDIWRHSERGDKAQSAEDMVISQIARRRLVGYLSIKPNKSRTKIYGSRHR